MSIYEECTEALQKVAASYGQHKSCPCAYPRFRQLAEFDFRRYGTTPVGCHVTDLAIGVIFGTKGGDGFMKREGANGPLTCLICGSTAEVSGEQYNINMEVTWFTWKTLKASEIGAPPLPQIPIPRGFYGLGEGGMNACADQFSTEAGMKEMVAYLTALRSPFS